MTQVLSWCVGFALFIVLCQVYLSLQELEMSHKFLIFDSVDGVAFIIYLWFAFLDLFVHLN